MSTPVQEKTAIQNSGESKKTPISDKPDPKENPDRRRNGKKNSHSSQLKQYQPRLMLEENAEEKTVLVKIGMRTSTRQIINYALSKVRNDWKVTLNAFQMDITKALQAAEIIKTRLPFLHQETKLQSYLATHKVEAEDKPPTEKKIIRTGIAISLCRNYFEVEDQAGYQKPKPRQFVQPQARGGRNGKDRVSSAPKDLRKRKNSKGSKGKKKPDKNDNDSNEERKDAKGGHNKSIWGGRKNDDEPQKSKKKNVEKREKSPKTPFDEPKKGRRTKSGPRQDPRDIKKRSNSGRFKDERRGDPRDDYRFGRDADYRRISPQRYGGGYYNDPYDPRYRPREFSDERRLRPQYERYGPPRGGGGMRGRGVPFARGGGRPQFDREPRERDDFERPERPGYYSGNRQFRMDKTRDQPIEKLHNRAADQIEKERYERINKRDLKNRPSQEQYGNR